MGINRGKQFEGKFKNDFLKIPNSSLDRLYDTQNGYKSISQISDYIGYVYPNIFYLECKCHEGNTFPLENLTQYAKLKQKVGIPGVRAGVVIWFIDHDKIIYVPITTITKLHADKKKSVNIRTISHDEYDFVDIPVEKRRVFLDADYSALLNLPEGW